MEQSENKCSHDHRNNWIYWYKEKADSFKTSEESRKKNFPPRHFSEMRDIPNQPELVRLSGDRPHHPPEEDNTQRREVA